MNEEFTFYSEVVEKYDQIIQNMKRNRFRQEPHPSNILNIISNLLKYKMDKILGVYSDLYTVCLKELKKEDISGSNQSVVMLNLLNELSSIFETLNSSFSGIKTKIQKSKSNFSCLFFG